MSQDPIGVIWGIRLYCGVRGAFWGVKVIVKLGGTATTIEFDQQKEAQGSVTEQREPPAAGGHGDASIRLQRNA